MRSCGLRVLCVGSKNCKCVGVPAMCGLCASIAIVRCVLGGVALCWSLVVHCHKAPSCGVCCELTRLSVVVDVRSCTVDVLRPRIAHWAALCSRIVIVLCCWGGLRAVLCLLSCVGLCVLTSFCAVFACRLY
jgi:hypothetical protein